MVDHLAMGVAPLHVPDLLTSFRVELPSRDVSDSSSLADLAHVARRWPQFAMVGLPGSGKSTALEQLAATWADDLEAPLPIMVRLRKLVSLLRDGQRISLADLCRFADAASEEIVPALVERLVNERAALLLDGLDECRDQRGQAVQLVRSLVTQLGHETGLVVTAREVASELICRTGLPVTVLKEPTNLESRALDLIDHVTASVCPRYNKDEVNKRRRWIKQSQSAHPSIWRIPLFAVLLAVHAATTFTKSLPASRADVLVTAIKDCVRRWESQKVHEPGAWEPELHPDMLLDGFGAIGHKIVNGPTEARIVLRSIADELINKWGLAPAHANAVASDITNWWVERIGVFINIGDCIAARVTLIVEVADAMWVVRQAPDVRSEWVGRVISDPVRYREPALLAAGLDREMVCQFIDAVHEPEALRWVADAVLQSAISEGRAVEILVDRLVDVVSQPAAIPPRDSRDEEAPGLVRRLNDRREQIDGPAWPYVLRLVRLPLAYAFRQKRDAAVRTLTGQEQSTVARALAIISDCAFDRRAPTDSECVLPKEVFTLPLPESNANPIERRSRRHRTFRAGRKPTLSGRAEAVAGAIRLTGLTEATAHAAARLLPHAPMNSTEELIDAMTEAGFGALATISLGIEPIFANMRNWLSENGHRDLRFILEEASEALGPNTKLPKATARWRLTGAASLIETLRLGQQNLYAGPDAIDNFPELVRHLIQLAIPATGLPTEVVADDSWRALELVNADALDTSLLLHVPPEPLRPISPSTPLITREDHDILAECLKSHNDWLFVLAAHWLSEEPADDQLAILWDALPHLTAPDRFALGCWLLAETQKKNDYHRFLYGNDSILRLASARIIGEMGTKETLINEAYSAILIGD